MRETGVARRRVVGDPDLSQRYFGLGRVLLGRMKSYLGAGVSGAKTWLLADGAIIRTSTGPHGDTIAIDVKRVGAAPCTLLPIPELSGFVFRPRSDTYPDSLPAGLQDVTIFQPIYDGNGDFTSYVVWFHDGEYNIADVSADYYELRQLDTCGKQQQWYTDIEYGNIDWCGPADSGWQLSWRGVPTRYMDGCPAFFMDEPSIDPAGGHETPFNTSYVTYDLLSSGVPTYEDLPPVVDNMFSGSVYYNGSRVKKTDGSNILTEGRIAGACLREISGQLYLFVIASGVSSVTGAVIQEKVYKLPVQILSQPEDSGPARMVATDAAVLIGTLNWHNLGTFVDPTGATQPYKYYNISPWFFNESGTAAVANRSQAPDGALHRVILTVNPTSVSTSVGGISYETDMIDAGSVRTYYGYYRLADYIGDALVELVYTGTGQTDHAPTPDVTTGNLTITVGGSVIFDKDYITEFVDWGGFLMLDLRKKLVGVEYRAAGDPVNSIRTLIVEDGVTILDTFNTL